jgi:hypothetical protein
MLTAFLIWLRLAAREFSEKFSYLTFVLCWSASVPLIYYSAELKQYSMDVLAAAVFFWVLSNQKTLSKGNSGNYVTILSLLPLLGLFSYPAFLFFIFPFYNLVMAKPKNQPALTAYCLSAVLVTAFVYCFDIRIGKADVHSQGFQDYSVSFQSAGEFFRTWTEGTLNLFGRWFVEQPRIFKKLALVFMPFGFLYMFYGFFKNIGKNKSHLASIEVLALPVYIELFILGCLGRYPFSVPRTSLFFCPMILILTIKGITELRKLSPYISYVIQALFVVFLVVVAAGLARVLLTQDFNFSPQIWMANSRLNH